jgi:hypothetical protein
MVAVIDIAEEYPGGSASLLAYRSTGMRVLALCTTRPEAEEACQDAQDRSGLQRLKSVEITY